MRQCNRHHVRAEGFSQIGPLNGKQLLRVLLAPTEGAERTELHNFPRLPPAVEGKEHIRSHQQIQRILGMRFFQLAQGVQGIAPALPVQLQVVHLDSRAQGLRRQPDHFQPLRRCGSVCIHALMGRDAGRNQVQPVQGQVFQRKARRFHMAQMDGIKGSAINSDFQSTASFPSPGRG